MQPCGGDGGATVFALLTDYRSLLARGLPPPARAFPPLLRACSASSALYPLGLALHLHAFLLGHAPADTFVSSSILHLYSSSGSLLSARRLFDEIPLKFSVVPWTTLIAAYSRAGCHETAFSFLRDMRRSDVRPNSVTFLSMLPLDLVPLQCLHASAFRHGLESNLALANALVNAYGRCGCVALARKLFDSMPERDAISWNSVLSGYSKTGRVREAFYLFGAMRNEGIHPDRWTYGSLVSSINTSEDGGRGAVALARLGKLVHAALLTSGHGLDAHIETALVGMYLKCGDENEAFLLFDSSSARRDAISWSAMISALVQIGRADKALLVFQQMLNSGSPPPSSALASAFSACAQLGSLKVGASIHGHVVRHGLALDVAAQNALVSLYVKCGRLKQSHHLFEILTERDVVSWNSLISGYAQNGHLEEAFYLFDEMRAASQRPDTITMVSLLQVCASMGALHHGRLVHAFMIRHEVAPSISRDTSLVDMYAKCGDLGAALRCFASMPEQDLVSWGAIIAGCGSHGMGDMALGAYRDFRSKGMKPNGVIFLAVLSACSHAGLVSEGLRMFKSMTEEFRLEPSVEHWGCIVDLLCKAGRLEEALGFANTMSPRPTADVLGILLDACRVGGFASLADEVARRITALRPDSANSYVQLAHSFAAMRRWDGVGDAWAQMRARGLRKAPAWSYVELHGNIMAFFAEHHAHPQQEDIVFLLKLLDGEMKELREISATRQLELSIDAVELSIQAQSKQHHILSSYSPK
ncbi:pentatricopeptide repeat-containing protein At4g04370-like [Zingiber officinale]|uniref:pentatricopeptide repeat-containing protein At4g04370-like n=1 Tax=Zingiber officinale TaxID=94328 RepID=UPI001C4D4855|nr:pentatricopeptide repeat-containing protein At4g04370-like [Zingiber officinale]